MFTPEAFIDRPEIISTYVPSVSFADLADDKIICKGWSELYKELLEELNTSLTEKAKKQVFFELIFMTYSYVHNAINHDAFPNAIELYNKEIMTGRGKGKYAYKPEVKEEAKKYMEDLMHKFFPNNEIKYIV